MPATYYPAILDRSASGYGVTFPDFPGCIAAGVTVSEAALSAEGALALHVEAMVKDKDALPAPSDLDEHLHGNGDEFALGILVRVDAPAKVERVLISLDSGLLRAIDAVAPNCSAWIADAARAALRGSAPEDALELAAHGVAASADAVSAAAEGRKVRPRRVRKPLTLRVHA